MHKAVAVAVDSSGFVYIAGESPNPVNGFMDYTVIKYDAANMAFVWSRTYDGPVSGHDRPTDIAVSNSGHAVIVTGTSAGPFGDDIATVAFESDGTPLECWPDLGEGVGVRRYDGPAGGADRGCELGEVSPDCDVAVEGAGARSRSWCAAPRTAARLATTSS